MKFINIFVLILLTLVKYIKSNCETMANSGYCQNPLYQKIMCQNCPKECSKYCIIPSPDPSCHDIASNCESMKELCNNPTYKPMMSKECPSTCDTCSGKTTTRTTTKSPSTTTSSSTTTSPSTTTTKNTNKKLNIF
uniref:ShKT domain-containing protein n=1 Tax=Strongyloides venezuelensis TaxID=75913 RepID=A0A0K0F9C8_STRVS